MTEALRAFLDGKVFYALTGTSEAAESAQSVRGYKQDPETWETESVTLTGRTLARIREHGVECDAWETPAWADPELTQC